MAGIETILAALLALPVYTGDAQNTAEARAELVRPVAVAIVAATKDPDEQAFLAAQAWHETRLARYVLEDRCADGPEGARCDDGKATGPWQVHGWCSAAWHGEATTRLAAGASCALGLYRSGRARCKTAAGGFAAQRGIAGRCEIAPEKWARRLRTMARVRLAI